MCMHDVYAICENNMCKQNEQKTNFKYMNKNGIVQTNTKIYIVYENN